MGRCSPPHGHAAWRGHAVRARRFPRETQAGASIGKADRASSGGRGSNVSQSGAFGRRSRTNAQASRPRTHDAFAHVEHGLSLRQWILPPVPEQNRTLRATPPTRYDRAFAFSRKTAFQLSEIQGEFFRKSSLPRYSIPARRQSCICSMPATPPEASATI